jgi:hypothetical protein
MLVLDKDGMVRDPRVRAARQATIERGRLAKVNGIIVHQTGGSTAAMTVLASSWWARSSPTACTRRLLRIRTPLFVG